MTGRDRGSGTESRVGEPFVGITAVLLLVPPTAPDFFAPLGETGDGKWPSHPGERSRGKRPLGASGLEGITAAVPTGDMILANWMNPNLSPLVCSLPQLEETSLWLDFFKKL